MTVHMVKLCVGADEVADLERWQKSHRQGGQPFHRTRMTPRRAEELIAGGSLYWVIRKAIRVRQRVIDVRACTHKGKPGCELVLDERLVRTYAKSKRPFQGWRYLDPRSAPPDLSGQGADAPHLPVTLDQALKDAGVW